MEAAPVIKKEPQPVVSVQVRPIIKEEPEPAKPVVKEEIVPKTKKRAGVKLIVDNKPKRKIRKENTNIDSIIDDLNLLAKKIS